MVDPFVRKMQRLCFKNQRPVLMKSFYYPHTCSAFPTLFNPFLLLLVYLTVNEERLILFVIVQQVVTGIRRTNIRAGPKLSLV